MDLPEFAVPEAPADRVYVSWDEHWVDRYVDHFLASHNRPMDDKTRQVVRAQIARFPGCGALRKADLDFFLAANLLRTVPF